MPIRYNVLAAGFVAAAMLATPAVAQEKPAVAPDRPEQATRIQRQDRARIHQPASGIERGRRSERPTARAGALQGARRASEAAPSRRGQQARDRNASRVRTFTRQRARVHRPGARQFIHS
jgi:hypothetical protein